MRFGLNQKLITRGITFPGISQKGFLRPSLDSLMKRVCNTLYELASVIIDAVNNIKQTKPPARGSYLIMCTVCSLVRGDILRSNRVALLKVLRLCASRDLPALLS